MYNFTQIVLLNKVEIMLFSHFSVSIPEEHKGMAKTPQHITADRPTDGILISGRNATYDLTINLTIY